MSYLIHLKKDIGRYEYIKNLINILNCKIWDGVDVRKYDDDGFMEYQDCNKNCTKGCSIACLNLLKHFLINNNSEYITIFEDDIIIHKKYAIYKKKIDLFIKKNLNWKIIYLGSSSSKSPHLSNINFNILKIPKKILTGGFAIMINKTIIPDIIKLISKNINKPHDLYGYGKIQQLYPDDCYVCSPNIIIANVNSSNIRRTRQLEKFSNKIGWNLENYIIPHKILMFIYSNNNNNNNNKIKKFIDLLSIYRPKIFPFIIFNDINIDNLDFLHRNNISYINNNNNNNNNIFQKYLQNYKYNHFIITNTNINWTINNTDNGGIFNIFQYFDEHNKNNKSLNYKFNIYNCTKCNETKKYVKTKSIKTGVSLINKKCINMHKINLINCNTQFYDTRTCNNKHH
jgi:GR25 family glycosyltransferase involved in LPS biosynthesis